jgi:hypothetical protein
MYIDASNATQPMSIRELIARLSRGNWTRLLDLALIATVVLAFLSDAPVFLFHVIFILLTIGAFFWKLRASVARACITQVVFQLPLKPIPEKVMRL